MTNGKSKEQELADIIAKHAAEMIIKETEFANVVMAVKVLKEYCQKQEFCDRCVLKKGVCIDASPEDWEVE